MEMKTPKLVTATVLTGMAVALAACGAGSSSHVVARLTPTTSVASTSTTSTAPSAPPSTVPGSTPDSTVVAAPATTTPSSALNPQTLNQVAADLGALDNSLTTANSDLNNPQGDS
jgi:hypothetical protein